MLLLSFNTNSKLLILELMEYRQEMCIRCNNVFVTKENGILKQSFAVKMGMHKKQQLKLSQLLDGLLEINGNPQKYYYPK